MIYILIQSVHLELMRIRRLKSEEFASCKTCKIYRLSLYSEKTNMYPKLIPVTPIKFEHLYSPGFVILSASDLSTCFIKNPLLFYFQSFHTSFVEFHVLVFTTNVYKYWIATWYLMPSEGAPIQKINHIESSFWGLCKAVRNAIADSPTGRSLQSLYIAPTYICLVQIFALLFYDSFTGSIEACCLIALHEALFASFM